MNTRNSKEQLSKDINEIVITAKRKGYIFSHNDAFALGFLAGKYRLEKILDNQEKVAKACEKYDETDVLALLDTISETLIDLDIIPKK